MDDIREEIDSQVEHFQGNMPAEIKALIRLANADLYYGPIYINEDGEKCSCFDEGAKPFDFEDACAQISAWVAENISDISVANYLVDDDGAEYEDVDTVDGSENLIGRKLLGAELFQHVH